MLSLNMVLTYHCWSGFTTIGGHYKWIIKYIIIKVSALPRSLKAETETAKYGHKVTQLVRFCDHGWGFQVAVTLRTRLRTDVS